MVRMLSGALVFVSIIIGLNAFGNQNTNGVVYAGILWLIGWFGLTRTETLRRLLYILCQLLGWILLCGVIYLVFDSGLSILASVSVLVIIVSVRSVRRRTKREPPGEVYEVTSYAHESIHEKSNFETATTATQSVALNDFSRPLKVGSPTFSWDDESVTESLRHIDMMDGKEFERWLAGLFVDAGWGVQWLGREGADQGADLLITVMGKRVVVQAKRYNSRVGNAAVQEVIAAQAYYKADEAWVVTNNYFTDNAKDLAKAAMVRLFDRDIVAKWIRQGFAAVY